MEKDMENKESFKERLNHLIEEREIAHSKLAKAIEVSTALISKYTSGKTKPSYDNFIKIAEFFDVSLDYLVGREEAPSQSNEQDQFYELINMIEILKKKNPEENYLIEKLKSVVEKMNENAPNDILGSRKHVFELITLMEVLEGKNLEVNKMIDKLNAEIKKLR